MRKRITLRKWGERLDPPPCDETLRRWVRDCRIFPIPEKIGRAYYVEEDARYINPNESHRYGT